MTSMDVGRVRSVAIGLLFAALGLVSADVASAAKAPALKVSKPSGGPLPGDAKIGEREAAFAPARAASATSSTRWQAIEIHAG